MAVFPFLPKILAQHKQVAFKNIFIQGFPPKSLCHPSPLPSTVKWPLPYFKRTPAVQFFNDDMFELSHNEVILVLTNNAHGAVGGGFF